MPNLNPLFQVANPDMNLSDSERFLKQIQQAQAQQSQQQMEYQQGLQSQLSDIQKSKQKDLTPLFMVGDLIAGTNTAPVANMIYNSPQQQQKELALQRLIGQSQRDLAGNQMDVLGLQYRAANQREMEKESQKNKLGYLNQQYDLMKEFEKYKAGLKKDGKGTGPDVNNPYVKKRLESAAKDASEYYKTGRVQLESSIEDLDLAEKTLTGAVQSGQKLFATAGAKAPDIWNTMLGGNEARVNVRQAMEKAIQDTLRPTLGAQFTEKEGERIMKLTIDPNVSDEENLRRVQKLKKYMQKKKDFADAYNMFLEQGGDPKGFPYEKFNMRGEFGAAAGGDSSGAGNDRYTELKNKYGID